MKNLKEKISKRRSRALLFKTAAAVVFSILLFNPLAAYGQPPGRNLPGRIRKPNGAGVAGVTLIAINVRTNFRATAVTDADGFYVFQNLPDGTYRIMVVQPGLERGFKIMTVATSRFPPNATPAVGTRGSVTRTSTASRSVGVPAIRPQKRAVNKSTRRVAALPAVMEFVITGTLSGVVTDKKANAVSGAQIKITNKKTNAVKEISADSNGHYQIENLDAGRYRIEIRGESFKLKSKSLKIRNGETKRRNFRLSKK